MMIDKSKWVDVLRRISEKAVTSMKLAGIVLDNRFENRASEPVVEDEKALDNNDRRKAKRLSLEKDIMFKYANGKNAFGHIINISRKGMYIVTDTPLNDGDEINANLLWGSLGSITSIEGHIVRRGDNGVAVRFI
jgi:hypothetical protein